MTNKLKFTKREQAKFSKVLAQLNVEFEDGFSYSGYNNDFGCPNCGDVGGFLKTVFRLKQLTGLEPENEG